MHEFPPVAGRFEKVPFAQYAKAAGAQADDSEALRLYRNIPLPRRSTSGSAGYDFFADRDYEIPPAGSAVISTGICCPMRPGWFLALYPRSGSIRAAAPGAETAVTHGAPRRSTPRPSGAPPGAGPGRTPRPSRPASAFSSGCTCSPRPLLGAGHRKRCPP